jgi:hypothetical protein
VNAHLAIVVALEQIETGDQAGAVLTLLEGLEGDAPAWLPYRCACGRRFRWHGELDAHLCRYGHAEVVDEFWVAA